MDIRLTRLGYRMHFSIEKVQTVTGVNSRVDPETHFLMWDFDEVHLSIVYASLWEVQDKYNLPPITIISTGKENSYHAYCFKGCSFRQARVILADTPNIDLKYLALGMMRGFFTLRFSDVPGRKFETVCELPSDVEADLDYTDVSSFVRYTKKEHVKK